MGDSIKFFIDGKVFTLSKPEPSLADVLRLAGLSPEIFYLVSEDGVEEYRDPKQRMSIQDGDRFKSEKREDARPDMGIIHYKVNGEEQETKENPLTVEEILRKAGAAASVDESQIESYFLENVADGNKYENLSDKVTIKENDQFLAVYAGRTPVA